MHTFAVSIHTTWNGTVFFYSKLMEETLNASLEFSIAETVKKAVTDALALCGLSPEHIPGLFSGTPERSLDPKDVGTKKRNYKFRSPEEMEALNKEKEPITESLKELWAVDDCRFRLIHPLRKLNEELKAKTNRDFDLEEIWLWLCIRKIPFNMLRNEEVEAFNGCDQVGRANWVCTLLSSKMMDFYKKDIVKRAYSLSPGDKLYSEKEKKASADSPDGAASAETPLVVREPGLSDFEFRINGRRYYSDPLEHRDIEIPESMEPRPDDDAWLNLRKGWVHNG